MTTLEKAARALLEAIENSQHAFGGEGTLATAREAATAALSAALLDPSDEVVEAVIEAICPYHQWADEGDWPQLNDAPTLYPCRGCKKHDTPSGGEAGCRAVSKRAALAMLRAAVVKITGKD